MINKLNEKAMLSHLSISNWNARKKDKQTGEEVSTNKHAELDVANVWVSLLPKDEMARIVLVANKIRKIWRKYTLPWCDDGMRILPSALFVQCNAEIKKAQGEFNLEVENFLQRYPNLVAKASQRLGDFIKNNPMPSEDEIRSKFGVKHNVLPFPDKEDFRCNLAEDEVAEIKINIEKETTEAVSSAMQTVWDSLQELVNNISVQMKKDKPRIFDSLIENISQYVKIIPQLNLTNDPNLNKIKKEIEEHLTTLDTKTLRKHPDSRKTAAKSADEIMAHIQSYTK